MDGIRGLTDASLEVDKRDYLAHSAFVGLRRGPQANRSETSGPAENLERGSAVEAQDGARSYILHWFSCPKKRRFSNLAGVIGRTRRAFSEDRFEPAES